MKKRKKKLSNKRSIVANKDWMSKTKYNISIHNPKRGYFYFLNDNTVAAIKWLNECNSYVHFVLM